MPRTEQAPRHASAMTADGNGLPKYLRVVAAVRRQIADGTLRPGQPAPSGAALSRVTGYSTLTCRRALRVLLQDGLLTPGPSRNARPRVAGAAPLPAERGLAAASRALSAGLAARRRANGLTQPALAERAGVSVTTVGHAETGRLWQSRQFWERADAVLGAGGELLRLHDAYREAGTAGTAGDVGGGVVCGASGAADEFGGWEPAPWPALMAGDPGSAGQPCPAADGPQTGHAHVMPACVTIVWSNGTVTTVHPPRTSPPRPCPPETFPPETSAGGPLRAQSPGPSRPS